MNGIFDLYDVLIQSKDIRDYFKQMWLMNALELEKLIIHANVPLTDKLSYLVWVRDNVAYGKDKEILSDMIDLYEKAIDEIFNTNSENLKFKVADIRLHSDEDESELINYFLICNDNWRTFDSFSDMNNNLSENKSLDANEGIVPYYRIGQYIQQSSGVLERQIFYTMTWIKGTLSVTDFIMDNDHLKKLGVREAVDFRRSEGLKDIPLPFNNDEVQIATPMMKHPICGKVVKALDDNEDYVYLFYPADDKFMKCPPLDLSYQKIDMTSDFITFDSVRLSKSS